MPPQSLQPLLRPKYPPETCQGTTGVPPCCGGRQRSRSTSAGVFTWWQVMSKAVHTKKPEMAWAAVVMRKMGCSTAVGLPSSGIQEKLGATAGVVAADPRRGAAVTSVIMIMVPCGARLRLGLLKSRPGAASCQGRERKSNSTQWQGLRRVPVGPLQQQAAQEPHEQDLEEEQHSARSACSGRTRAESSPRSAEEPQSQAFTKHCMARRTQAASRHLSQLGSLFCVMQI